MREKVSDPITSTRRARPPRIMASALARAKTNPAQTEVLYQLAIDGAELLPGQRLLDAYCGTGTIGICAASLVEGLRVIGVEQVGDADARAGRNARANGVGERCRFLRSDATEYMDATVRADRPDDRFDVVRVLGEVLTDGNEGSFESGRAVDLVEVEAHPLMVLID